MNKSRSATMSGFQWVKWVSDQVKRSWWESRVSRASCVKLGVNLAAARLDAEDVDQLLVGLDQPGLERRAPAECGLGLPDAAKLAMEAAGQQMGLGRDRMRVRDPAEAREGSAIPALRRGELGLEHPVQPGPGPKPLQLHERSSRPIPVVRRGTLARRRPRAGQGRHGAAI